MKKPVTKKKSVVSPNSALELEFIAELTRLRVTHYKKDDVEIVIHPSAFVTTDKPTRAVGETHDKEPEIDLDELAFQTAFKGGQL